MAERAAALAASQGNARLARYAPDESRAQKGALSTSKLSADAAWDALDPTARIHVVRGKVEDVTTSHLLAMEPCVQTGPDGRQMRGAMTLARPGKVRFQYEPTVPFLVVADGRQVSLVDYEVAQVQRAQEEEAAAAGWLRARARPGTR